MSTERGYIALYRGFFDHPMFKAEPFTEREAFAWMIMEAAHEGRRVRRGRETITLSRGELCHSVRFMAKAWKWRSSSRVVRVLEKWKNETAIVVKTEHETTHITICNYDKYQGSRDGNRNADGTLFGSAAEQRRNADGTLTEQTKPLNHLNTEIGGGASAPTPASPTKEKRTRRAAEIPLPPTEGIPAAYREHAKTQGVEGAAAEREWRKFRDHAEQKDRRCAGERGWFAAWRGWITKAIEFSPAIVTAPPQTAASREQVEARWISLLAAEKEGRGWISKQVKKSDIPADFVQKFDLEHASQVGITQ